MIKEGGIVDEEGRGRLNDDERDSDWSWSVLFGPGSAAAACGVTNKGRCDLIKPKDDCSQVELTIYRIF